MSIGQEYEKAIQTIKELPLTIIDKKVKKLEPSEYYYYLLQENKEKSDEIDFDAHCSWGFSDSEESIETQKNITTEIN